MSSKHSTSKNLKFREKTLPHTCSGQTFCQKKYGFQQKGNLIFPGQTLRQKKYGFKKNMLVSKKGTYIFSGQKLCQKKVWVPKKKCQKKYELQKNGHSDSYFFGPNIVPIKVWVPKKKEIILFQAKHCARKKIWVQKKRMSSKRNIIFVYICSCRTLC